MSKIIDIIAPAGPLTPQVLTKISEFLQTQGLTARIPENILGEDLLCANDDQTRAQLLQQALLAKDSDFIWCARGGYGLTKLIPSLKKLKKPKIKKTVLGFSDVTALHLFLSQKWGWHTIHGPNASSVVEQKVNKETITATEQIFKGKHHWQYALTPINQSADNANISGDLTGGNLSLIEASLGTFWQIESKKKILLIEEANEWTYRAERSLIHLEQAQAFKNIKALILGNFSHDSSLEEEKITTMLKRFAEQQNFPIFRSNFFGHGQQNAPWIYGPAKIENHQLIQK